MTKQRAALWTGGLLAAALQLRFLLGSARNELISDWIPDDAFYYLQPAWNAGQGRGFSFDGLEPTYGFQPLWALVLALWAAVLPSKDALLDVSLVLGVGLHLGTGVLLARWLGALGRPRAGWLAGFLWVVNPPLLLVTASGMEAGLVALLLTASLLRMARGIEGRAAWGLGALLGLLLLARVSMLPAALLFVAWSLRTAGRRGWRVPAGAALTALPWFAYATVALGQPMPITMAHKLAGGWAGMGRFLAALPGVPDGLVRALLPGQEGALMAAPQVVIPTWEGLWTLGLRAPVGWAGGNFLPTGTSAVDGVLGGAVLVLLGVGAWRAWVARRHARGGLGVALRRAPPSLLLLAAVAVANGLANNLLLSLYVKYCYWYRVPELLLLVALAALALDAALGPRTGSSPLGDRAGRVALLALAVVALVGVGRAVVSLQPRGWDAHADRFANGMLSIAAEVERRVPEGEKVGCWNSGLLGWVVQGRTVVNLDGLANTPEYGRTVARREVLARMGVGEPATLEWMREHEVRWAVDVHRVADLGRTPFYEALPVGSYRPVARSPLLSSWVSDRRDHAVVLVEVEQDARGVSPSPAAP